VTRFSTFASESASGTPARAAFHAQVDCVVAEAIAYCVDRFTHVRESCLERQHELSWTLYEIRESDANETHSSPLVVVGEEWICVQYIRIVFISQFYLPSRTGIGAMPMKTPTEEATICMK